VNGVLARVSVLQPRAYKYAAYLGFEPCTTHTTYHQWRGIKERSNRHGFFIFLFFEII
jgi:hypothetical protein